MLCGAQVQYTMSLSRVVLPEKGCAWYSVGASHGVVGWLDPWTNGPTPLSNRDIREGWFRV